MISDEFTGMLDQIENETTSTKNPAASGETRTQSIEESGEFEGAPKPDNNKNLLTPDQRNVMHRISEAIAILIYSEELNPHIVKLASGGTQGVVYAVEAIMEKVVASAKPGIPRELLPLAVITTLALLQDFMSEMGNKDAINMREVIPFLIDRLSRRFEATRPERLALRKMRGMIARGTHAKKEPVGDIGAEMPRPDEDTAMPEGGPGEVGHPMMDEEDVR